MKHFAKFAVLGAALAVSTSSAFATPLAITPGNTVTPTAGSASDFTGLLVASESGTASDSTLEVSYMESVYQGGTAALCPVCLTFVIQDTDIANTSGATGVITSSSLYNLTGFTTDVEYIAEAGGVAPTSVGDDSIGGTITFNFANNVGLNANTDELVILTNAINYSGAGNMGVHDGVLLNISGLEPAPGAPEPNSLVLLGTGLVGAAGLLMRRRQQQQTAA